MTSKPILVYPNSGESYDADRKEWVVSRHIQYLFREERAQLSELLKNCCRKTQELGMKTLCHT